MATILKNRTSQPKCFVLSAGAHLAELIPPVRVEVPTVRVDAQTGERSIEKQRRRLPSSLSLMPKGVPGDTTEPLPNWVRLCDDVKTAIARRELEVIDVADAAQVAPEVMPQLEEASAPSEGSAPKGPKRGDK